MGKNELLLRVFESVADRPSVDGFRETQGEPGELLGGGGGGDQRVPWVPVLCAVVLAELERGGSRGFPNVSEQL